MADGSGYPLAAGPRDPGPSGAVLYRIRAAEQQLAKAAFLRRAGPRLSPRIRRKIKDLEGAARRLLNEATDLARSEEAAAWIEGAIAETLELAALRGEVLEPAPKGGAKGWTVRRGCGLEQARDNGYLEGAHGRDRSDDLFDVGLRYGAAYELIHGRASNRGEGGGGFGPKGPQIRQAEAGQELAAMRQGLSDKQRRVLDAVCGEGLGLHVAGQALRIGAPALRNALRGGLGQAAHNLRAAARARRAGEVQDLGGDLQAAAEAVARAARS